jgi:hypothetical protein
LGDVLGDERALLRRRGAVELALDVCLDLVACLHEA